MVGEYQQLAEGYKSDQPLSIQLYVGIPPVET